MAKFSLIGYFFHFQNYDTVSQQHILDTNQSDAWMYTDELPSQTQTNRSSLVMTTTSLPVQPLQSRDEIESSIREFSRLWPSQTQTVQPHTSIGFNDSRNCTIASGDIKNDNYLKRNGALVSGGVPLAPLTLQTEPNAWDLPSSAAENQNRKLIHMLSFVQRKGECSIDCANRCFTRYNKNRPIGLLRINNGSSCRTFFLHSMYQFSRRN